MQNNNMREVWEGMKTITGCSSKRGTPIEGDVGSANQLNHFFNRFDHPNPFTPLNTAAPTLLLPQAVTSKKEVAWITDYLTGRPQKGQSRLYFLRRLVSFNICKKLLQSVVASAFLYAVVCWGQPQEEGRSSAPGQTAAGTGRLVAIEGKMNAAKYRDILEENLFQSAQDLRLGRRFTFQQDNDPKHTAKGVVRNNSVTTPFLTGPARALT
ncbi:hypothetical protein L3Q82_000671 [Scortum barcoo]|uniref:Uncharacterized protein n=1 Tax=Scortum barcoo TaxID=214431 RepID=A0ACB8WFC4_9TELE|nr:hypothetical protein L3Q82_000671 [Scortum barcoo]